MKKVLIPLVIFLMVMMTGILVVKAARPERPVYPTVDEVQQMISDAIAPIQLAIDNLGNRLSLVETAVTGNSQEIQNLKNTIPSPQPTPPFDMEMVFETEISRNNDPGFRFIKVKVTLTNPTQSQNSPFNANGNWAFAETNVWGVAHTPDGDVNAKIIPDWIGTNEFSILSFTMLDSYQYGTQIPVDVYAEYGGKVNKQTLSPNTN